MKIRTLRTFIGLTQGFILAALYYASEPPIRWPATKPELFIPLVMVMLFVPLILLQSLANMRWRTLLVWASTATVLIFGISYYSVFRQVAATTANMFSPLLFICTAITLFITHALILSADNDKRVIAHYPTYFDIAWKLAVQITFTAAFTLLFWMLLELGAGLFDVIHLYFFKNFINNSWFAIPASTLAISIALHITDVNVHIVRGIRTLILLLLSWLLPVLTGIITLFLLSLFLSNHLTLLWQTGHASLLLLISAAILIMLINAVYQDGQFDHSLPTIQRYSAMLASILLIPLSFLAIYSLSLRVQQYGWSVERINAAAVMTIFAFYAVGYTFAVCMRGGWLKLIEHWNVAAAVLIIATFLVLFTPVADPARLMVASQLSRLQSGRIAPEKFDFQALDSQGQRFGRLALQTLQTTWQGPQAEYVHTQAKIVLSRQNPKIQLSDQEKSLQLIVHTSDGKLPSGFLNQKWGFFDDNIPIPSCLQSGKDTCHAWIMQTSGKPPMILLLDYNQFTGFQQDVKGVWKAIGTWSIPYKCREKMRAAAIAGQFKMVPAVPVQADIELMGWRTHFTPAENPQDLQACTSKK